MVTGGDRPDAVRTDAAVDFFVSYAMPDLAWAEWIGWQLEAAGYRVLVRAWDFTGGSNVVTETQRALSTSARMIAVLSSAYLVSAMETAQWQAIWADDPTGAQRRLVVTRVEDCPRPGLLRPLVGVDLFGLGDDAARERLLGVATSARQKPTTPPPFPASAAPDYPGLHETSDGEPRLSPFPGLAAFDANRAGAFRGREPETRHLADRMIAHADAGGLMAVVGPSGCGKSSLVAAGLTPRLAGEADWLTLLPMTPSDQPAAALAVVLADAGRRHGLDWDAETLTRRLADPDAIGQVIGELLAAANPARWLLLVIDQAEELLVRTSPADRDRFLALLAVTIQARVRVVATLRSEYLDPLLEAAAPTGLSVAVEPVLPLSRDLLPLVIAEPARMSGLHIDDELVARMVTDTGDGHALPLLAYTLQRLHLTAQAAATHVLSAGLYEQIGGVQQALIEQADAALTDATTTTGRSQQDVLAGLLALVTVDTDNRPIRRRIPLDQLPDLTRAQLLPFVSRRLLVLDATPDGPVTVEVAHERLLTAWPSLNKAIATNAERLRQRAQAETAATDWQLAGRPAGQLWGYSRADSTLDLLIPDELTPTTRQFLTTSRRHARRRITTAITILIALLLAASSLGITAYLQAKTAEDGRRTAVADQLLTLADNARTTDPALSLRLAVAADTIAPKNQQARARSNLLQTLAATPHLRTTIASDTATVSSVNSVMFSPDGILAVGSQDGAVRLWDVNDPGTPRRPGSRPSNDISAGSSLASVVFGPDGLLTSVTQNGEVRLWDINDPGAPQRLSVTPSRSLGSVNSAVSGPDGLLATGDGSGVRLWDISGRATPRPLGASNGTGSVNSVVFGPDGLLASGGSDGTVRLWDISDRTTPRALGGPLTGHTGPVYSVVFGPDGLLASGGSDGTVRLWDISGWAAPRPLGATPVSDTEQPNALALGPNGLLATGGDGGVKLWDVSSRGAPHLLGTSAPTDSSQVRSLAFGPNGLLATGGDGGVKLWDVSSRGAPHLLGTSAPTDSSQVRSLAFGPNGLLATGGDGGVKLWDVSSRGAPHLLGTSAPTDSSEAHSLAFGPNGLLATGDLGMVRLWDVSGRAAPHLLSSTPPSYTYMINQLNAVAFSPNGLLAFGGSDGAVRLWDISNREAPRPLGDPLTGATASVYSLAFGPDGILAVGANDGTVRLWDVSDRGAPRPLGDPIASVTNSRTSVNSVAVAPDGLLAAGGDDGTVRMWDIGVLQYLRNAAVQVACQRAGRGLDKQEWTRYLATEPYRNTCPASAQ
ncbi:TIR domain-containing protein [Pseudofrankia saprophytica]|nr:TIR domain-containing protein [Pseudofrankia saprophytica]